VKRAIRAGFASFGELGPWRSERWLVLVGADRLAKAARTEPAVTRARLSELLTDAGMAGLAAKVPPADRRVRERALASFK
jgi:hypothetical protein